MKRSGDVTGEALTSKTTLCILSKSAKYAFVLSSSLNTCNAALQAWHVCAIKAPVGHFNTCKRSLLTTTYCTMGADILPSRTQSFSHRSLVENVERPHINDVIFGARKPVERITDNKYIF